MRLRFYTLLLLFCAVHFGFSQALEEDHYKFNHMLWEEYTLIQERIWTTHGAFIKKEISGGFENSKRENYINNLDLTITLSSVSTCSKLSTPVEERLACSDKYYPDKTLRFKLKRDAIDISFQNNHIKIEANKAATAKLSYVIKIPYSYIKLNGIDPETKHPIETRNAIRLYKKTANNGITPASNLFYVCKIKANKSKDIVAYTKQFKTAIKTAFIAYQNSAIDKHLRENKAKILSLYNYDDNFMFYLLDNDSTYRIFNNILSHNNFIHLTTSDVEEMRQRNFPTDLIDKLILVNTFRILLEQQNFYFFNQSKIKNYGEQSRYLIEKVSPILEKNKLGVKDWHRLLQMLEKIRENKYNRNMNYWPTVTLNTEKFHLNSQISNTSKSKWKNKYPIAYYFTASTDESNNISQLLQDHNSLLIACNLSQTDDKKASFKKDILKAITTLDKSKKVKILCLLACNGYDELWDVLIQDYSLQDVKDPYYKGIYADIELLKQRTLAFSFIEYQAHVEKNNKLIKRFGRGITFKPKGIKYFKVISSIPYKISPYNNKKVIDLINFEKEISSKMIEELYSDSENLRRSMTNFFNYVSTPYTSISINSTEKDREQANWNTKRKREAFENWLSNFVSFSTNQYAKKEIERTYFDKQNEWLNTIYSTYGCYLTRVITNEHSQHSRGMKNTKNYLEWDKITFN
jgi:hypothetical protein